MMQLGIFAKTFARPTPEAVFDAVADHGLARMQFNLSCAGLPTLPERIDEDLCARIARLTEGRGLAMAAISGTFNLCDPDRDRLRDDLRRLEVLAAACRRLGRPYFTWLKRIGYTGAVVMHGLDESEVEENATFLRMVMDWTRRES